MKKYFIVLALIACATVITAQHHKILKSFDELETRYFKNNDTTYVINFWATWCKPCVHELPFFDEFSRSIADNKIKVILVSLDFESQIEKHVIPYISAKKLHPENVILLDRKYNDWIPKLDEKWDGDIPATLLLYGENRKFISHVFESTAELKKYVEDFIFENE